MKKSILLILLVVFSLLYTNVYASTRMFDRTDDNLLVPDYVEVTEANKSNIMMTPAIDAKEKIYDFADLFNNSEEDNLFSQIANFSKQTNLDLAIVTVDYNNKHNSAMYADDFYDYNAFGLGDDHRGLLFLIDMDIRNIYVTTTGEAINIYTDQRINNILDNVFSYMSDGKYYAGTSKFINLALSYTKVNSNEDSKYVINDNGELVKDRRGIIVALIVAIVITIIVLIIMASMNNLVAKANSSKSFLKKDTLRVKKIRDVFLGSTISKVRIDNDSSSGGHHNNGGSSIHTGSSGISHGGGGHHF